MAPAAPGGEGDGPIRPYLVEIPEEQIEDLRDRLRRTRWPEAETVEDWSQGIPLSYVQELCRYWGEEYRWRDTERRLNALPQFRVAIDGLDHHFIHVRSPHPGALPAGHHPRVARVGGGVPQGHRALDRSGQVRRRSGRCLRRRLPLASGLRVQRATGGDGVDASIGSPGPGRELMALLGYERYGAQGGDWGSMVTASLARQDPEHVVGIHLNMPVVGRDAMSMEGLTAAEEATLAHMAEFQKWETGYSGQQSTRPQTLGYGLADSPAGQCAWIVEKFRCVDRLRRTPRKRPHPRRDAGQRDAVLAARYRRIVGPALLGELPQRGSECRLGTHRMLHLPQGGHPVVAPLGGEAVHRSALLERAGPGRALRGVRATRPVRRRAPVVLRAWCGERRRRITRPG